MPTREAPAGGADGGASAFLEGLKTEHYGETFGEIFREEMVLRKVVERIMSALPKVRKKYRGLRGRGQEWESLAERYLKKAGYRILDRNVRTKVGEIDLVAEENGVLCFVEVKGRRGTGFGLPEEAVDAEKQRRIFRAAEAYLQSRHLADRRCRFDVVAILQNETSSTVALHRDAFVRPPPPRPAW